MRMVHSTLGSGQRDGQGQTSQYGEGEHPLPENESVEDPVVITLGGAGEGRPVREGGF